MKAAVVLPVDPRERRELFQLKGDDAVGCVVATSCGTGLAERRFHPGCRLRRDDPAVEAYLREAPPRFVPLVDERCEVLRS